MATREAWRWLVALLLIGGAVALHAGIGVRFWAGLLLWGALALALGAVMQRWTALPLAALPWPLGIGLGLATGRYAFLGDGWQLPALLSLIVGLGGIALGVVVMRTSRPLR